MGCDIHWCLEMRRGDHWLGLLTGNGSKAPAADRWYGFFAQLAGVRPPDDDNYPQPNGLPDDVSELTELDIDTACWDHSHGSVSVDEFVAAYNRAQTKWQPATEKLLRPAEIFGLEWWPWDKGHQYRVVFAFDN